LPAAFTALVAKDFKLLTRDLRNLSQLITPMVLGVVYTLSLVSGTRRGPVTPFDSQMIAYGGLGTALFVAWIFAGRLALGGIGMEGKRYWLLKVAPLPAEVLLAAKFAVAYLPAIVLGTLFLLATAIAGRQSFSTLPYNWVALAAAIAALCAVYLAFGTVGANLRWEDPRHITSGTMGCLGWIAGTATVAIVSGVFTGIPLLFSFFKASMALAQLAGLVVGLGLCTGILMISLLWARTRVAVIGEG
jgi:hypothetical protein